MKKKQNLKTRFINYLHDTVQAFRMALSLPYGHYSLSSEPAIHLKALPEKVKKNDYYRLSHPRDLYEVLSVEPAQQKIVVRSVRTNAELTMTPADFEEMFRFQYAFVRVGEHVEVGAPIHPIPSGPYRRGPSVRA